MVDEHKTEYTIAMVGTRKVALFPGGRWVPVIMGASGAGDGGDGGDGDTGGDDNNDGGSDGGGTGTISFSPEQQTKVDALISETYKKALKLGTDANKTEIEKLKSDLAELQAGKKPKKGEEDLTAFKERLADLENREKQSKERDINANILSIASELNAINASQVVQLVSGKIKVDDDGVLTVVNEEGQPRLNGSLKPMTVKEYIAEFLESNPHLVKASGNGGSGSQGAKFGDFTKDMSALLKLPPVERIKVAREAGIK